MGFSFKNNRKYRDLILVAAIVLFAISVLISSVSELHDISKSEVLVAVFFGIAFLCFSALYLLTVWTTYITIVIFLKAKNNKKPRLSALGKEYTILFSLAAVNGLGLYLASFNGRVSLDLVIVLLAVIPAFCVAIGVLIVLVLKH